VKRPFSLWLPVALWMALLFYLSSRSSIGLAGQVPDWITHGGAYLVLGCLLCRAIAAGLRPLSVAGAVLATAVATLYGMSDEYHQSFVPGRDASWGDVAKDLAGATIGAIGFRRATRNRGERRRGAA
jgi:VanZ family protein